ncbi:MAG: hypothetical protein AABX31_05915, partial [Nanoarchaeota archaeon]
QVEAPPQFQCTGSTPTNSVLCPDDDSGLSQDTPKKAVSTCDMNKCEYHCNVNYKPNAQGTDCELAPLLQPPPPEEESVCGNVLKEGTEQCDDGNNQNGDGCSSACMTESGFTCTGEPSVCTPAPQQVCTPKQYECETATARKQCNADGTGYLYAKDYPAMNCAQGETCSNGICVMQQPQQVCGNGVKDGTEQCDGNDLGGATCVSINQGFASGTLKCVADCKSFDTAMCVKQVQQQVCTPNQYVCEGTTAKKQCKADGTGYNTAMNCAQGETCSNGACVMQQQPLSATGKKITLTDVPQANNVFSTKITATESFNTEVTVYTILYGANDKVLSIKSEKLETGLAKDATYTATVNYPEANVKKKSVIVYDVKQNPSVFGQLQVQKQ